MILTLQLTNSYEHEQEEVEEKRKEERERELSEEEEKEREESGIISNKPQDQKVEIKNDDLEKLKFVQVEDNQKYLSM